MEHISSVSSQLVRSGASHDEQVAAFQAEWRAVFGKSIDAKVASDYLKHIGSMKLRKSFTRKGKRGMRGMRGGQAPVSYITRPGEEIPHGTYPDYISKGFWNPEPAILKSCGTQEGVVPYASTGSNQYGQAGGSMLGDLFQQYIPGATAMAAVASRPYVAENPATMIHNASTTWKGQSTGPGAASYDQAWAPRMHNQVAPIPIAITLERTLGTDIRNP
jgi:hypothetical protein